MSRPSKAPRLPCTCGRLIAVVGGCFARHDPVKPRRRKRGARAKHQGVLVSCPGSLTPAPILRLPDRAGTQSLFEYAAEVELGIPGQSAPTLEQHLEEWRTELLVSA